MVNQFLIAIRLVLFLKWLNLFVMRTDLNINTITGDLVLSDFDNHTLATFRWTGEADRFIEGEVQLPPYFDTELLVSEGVKVAIPYTPVYKPMRIVFQQSNGAGFVQNPETGYEWFDVKCQLYGMVERSICASELLLVYPLETYVFQIDNVHGTALLWSGKSSDTAVVSANIQNRNMLLQCVAGNNYRYPTSGVGVIQYLHASISNTGMSDSLMQEFADDNVRVVNASYDSNTGMLDLDLDFSKADNE